MDRTNQVIDEYTLAAFIAGTLSDERRAEVVAYLAENADARELLHMAYEALEAAKEADAAVASPAPAEAARLPVREPDRGATARPVHRRLHGLSRYIVATVVVFSVGLGLRLAFGPTDPALRNFPPPSGELTVQVSASDLAFAWSAVPDASRYQVVIFDQAGGVVARHETAEPSLSRSDAFVASLRDKLTVGYPYSVRIDAIDAQNRTIQSSETVEFTRRP